MLLMIFVITSNMISEWVVFKNRFRNTIIYSYTHSTTKTPLPSIANCNLQPKTMQISFGFYSNISLWTA